MSTHTAEAIVCPCCNLPQESLRRSPWVSEPVCSDCLFEWYEGASVSKPPFTGSLGVRRASRLRQGFVMETYEP